MSLKGVMEANCTKSGGRVVLKQGACGGKASFVWLDVRPTLAALKPCCCKKGHSKS